ncbi:MAG: hypothetical protein ACOYW9_14105 [Deinococcota bacterium]|nr:hypothetical protein [Allomeiothermus silvanus]
MSYETRLAELVHEPVLTQLEGQGGLLALTGRELWLLDEQGQQHAPLNRIRRITRGEGGTVMILGEIDTLMTIPLRSFEVNELKMFLESLKEHVIRARKGISTAVENPPAAPIEPAPEPAAAESAPPLTMPKPVAISEAGPEPTNTPEPTSAEPVIPRSYIEEPEEVPVTPTIEQAPMKSHSDPAIADTQTHHPVWEEAPSPRAEASTQVWAESPAAPPPEEVAVSPTLAPPVASAPARRGGTSTLLKLMSLITLGATLAYLVNQILTPSGNIWGLVGVAVVGSGLALIEWRLSE